ncbi:MAG: 4-hydroxy-tetrahydrodipicolinate synthase [Lachnospiraceae bacterium]|jgi:dihydrodipicolinate synthase|nr:4-hydroxy-tetrahydrodipicolinate synthase [Lachnospiraceae bacterium]MCI8780375.1 4-hydroxy-tetrahydrodipicolinate synthase [Lachnospiraceae bacterium]
MSIFTGAGVALITPMHEDGSVNYEEMERIVNDQILNGTDAIIVCGTTGEASTMTHEEHIETIKACVDMTKKRVPVIAGTGSNCTATAAYLSKEAQNAGADGVLVVSPYYNKATQAGLKKHFTEIAKAIDIPVILYNIPGRTGVNIQPKTIADMVAEVENIIGVKEASGDLSQVAELLSLTQGEIDVYSGNDDQIVPIVALGGKGVISVLSHVAPKDTHDMVIKLIEGDVEGSRNLQLKYIPLITALFSEVNPIPVKAAMELMGFQAGPLRMPLTRMEEAHKQVLRQAMIDAGVKVIG